MTKPNNLQVFNVHSLLHETLINKLAWLKQNDNFKACFNLDIPWYFNLNLKKVLIDVYLSNFQLDKKQTEIIKSLFFKINHFIPNDELFSLKLVWIMFQALINLTLLNQELKLNIFFNLGQLSTEEKDFLKKIQDKLLVYLKYKPISNFNANFSLMDTNRYLMSLNLLPNYNYDNNLTSINKTLLSACLINEKWKDKTNQIKLYSSIFYQTYYCFECYCTNYQKKALSYMYELIINSYLLD